VHASCRNLDVLVTDRVYFWRGIRNTDTYVSVYNTTILMACVTVQIGDNDSANEYEQISLPVDVW
jgi:hypothetical protein